MNAFECGWQDVERGKSLKDCPYYRGTGAAIAWRQGFIAMLASVGL